MSGSSKDLSVMLLTEDSGAEAYDTVQVLVKAMFKLLVTHVRTNRIAFKPLEEAQARIAMRGTDWKSNKPLFEQARRLLIRSIINELLKPNGFVLYHIDGDVSWSEHESSGNVDEFRRLMLRPIEEGVRSKLKADADATKRMKRFRLLVPFYSIEAWLYQHTQEARRLCREKGCGQCDSTLARWEAERASLDEISRPKTETLCFKARFNKELAGAGFPAQEVFDSGASFTRAVEGLLECDELTDALERTWLAPQ